ncbi:hypothetical protein HPB50_013907 [Hyalomma asiaticum]|uniref:Uncharacterized protein n=1 Tax=Hyalomma asiaticum TaxID=266040 RepID=A0ACB7SSP2_HYAAI|nr:hypothetical protein HPB50_013907 [Hyalomma asiaticum]
MGEEHAGGPSGQKSSCPSATRKRERDRSESAHSTTAPLSQHAKALQGNISSKKPTASPEEWPELPSRSLSKEPQKITAPQEPSPAGSTGTKDHIFNRYTPASSFPDASITAAGATTNAAVRHCNREACDFNSRLRQLCRRSRQVFFLDHALEWFPPKLVLDGDGVRPSFEGVALMASHISYLVLHHDSHPWSSSCCNHAPIKPVQQATSHAPAQDKTSKPSANSPEQQGTSTDSNAPSQARRQPRPSTKRCESALLSSRHHDLRSAKRSATLAPPQD